MMRLRIYGSMNWRGPDHMVRFGKEDNFDHGAIFGPCSEIYYDRREFGAGLRLQVVNAIVCRARNIVLHSLKTTETITTPSEKEY